MLKDRSTGELEKLYKYWSSILNDKTTENKSKRFAKNKVKNVTRAEVGNWCSMCTSGYCTKQTWHKHQSKSF